MALTRKQIQTKLDKLVSIANELDDEAKRRWGPEAMLFFESEGTFHMMSGDSDHGFLERQKFVEQSSDVNCRMGAGAW